MSTLQNYYCHCLCPSSELHPPAPCHPPTCAFSEDPPILADRSDPISYEVPAFSLGFGVHETLHTFSKSGSPSPVELLSSNPTGHQNQIFCGFLLPLTGHSLPPATPRIGSLIWGSERLIVWENFCVIIVFQFVGCSHGMYGI